MSGKIIILIVAISLIICIPLSILIYQEEYRMKHPFAMARPDMYKISTKVEGNSITLYGFLLYSSFYIIDHDYKVKGDVLYIVIYSSVVGRSKDPHADIGGFKYTFTNENHKIEKIILVGGIFDKSKVLYSK